VYTLFADVLDVMVWSPSRSGRFIHWIGDWMGPQSRSERWKEGKNLSALPGIKPRFLGCIVVITQSELSQLRNNGDGDD